MTTLLEWNCDGLSSFNANDFSIQAFSPGFSSTISTANPRSGAATPQHYRVTYDSFDSHSGNFTLESPTGGSFNHIFVTMYVSHSANYTPYISATKMLIFKNDTGLNHTYLEAGLSGGIAPAVVIQNMPGGADNFEQNIGAAVDIVPGGGYYRLDFEVRLNSSGQSNGIVRMYINGVKKLEYLNVNMQSTGQTWNLVDVSFLGNGSGTFPMFRDMDRLWISTTALDAGDGSPGTPTNVRIMLSRRGQLD